jgi:hypothetical protein
MPGVLVDEAERDLVQRGLHGGDLGQHVDAVTVVLDHALDPADLAFDAPQAFEELVLGGGVAASWGRRVCGHAHSIPPVGIGYSAPHGYPLPV